MIFLTTLWLLSCHAQMIEKESMKDIFNDLMSVNLHTLVVFDVDMVLVQPSDPAFQMANMKRFNLIAKKIMKTVPVEKQMLFLSLMTTSSRPILIDDQLHQYLTNIKLKKIPMMALTANLTGEFNTITCMEKWRVEGLRELGIDFSQSAPYSRSIAFNDLLPYRNNYSIYLDGILFVNGTTVSKGEALVSFLQKTQLSFNKIVFIDDREENLKSVQTFLQTHYPSMEYNGLHYTGAQAYPSKSITEEEFESKWQKLADEAIKLN